MILRTLQNIQRRTSRRVRSRTRYDVALSLSEAVLATSHITDSASDLTELAVGLRKSKSVRPGNSHKGGRELPESLQADELAAWVFSIEAVRRTFGFRVHIEQLAAAILLSHSISAEVATGEGKTIIGFLAAANFALHGRKVHVATTNEYLAERDLNLLLPSFRLLGLTASWAGTKLNRDQKKVAYEADVVYATGNELAFDYLRDQLADRDSMLKLGGSCLATLRSSLGKQTRVQRWADVALVDEADSVLIDEASIPMILGVAVGGQDKVLRERLAEIWLDSEHALSRLTGEVDYRVDNTGGIEWTATGLQRLQQFEPLFFRSLPIRRTWREFVEQSIRARRLVRDRDYAVIAGKVQLVDCHTGRIHEERKWQSGLHQAIEAKENVAVTEETEVGARITRQRFFRRYRTLVGMSGTLSEAVGELSETYDVAVEQVPTHVTCRRRRLDSRLFITTQELDAAVISDVRERLKSRQPILIGTRSIAASERISTQLSLARVQVQLLNGKQDEEEALIISRSGIAGTVTIATNMAGRGTDIRLDEEARVAGGLHVIGLEHHESSRVDRQLEGRSARQGDPGSAQFFASLEDHLFQDVNFEAKEQLRKRLALGNLSDAAIQTTIRDIQQELEAKARYLREQLANEDDRIQATLNKIALGN